MAIYIQGKNKQLNENYTDSLIELTRIVHVFIYYLFLYRVVDMPLFFLYKSGKKQLNEVHN